MLRLLTSLAESINAVFQFANDWFRRRQIEKAAVNEAELQNDRRVLRLVAQSDEVRDIQSRADDLSGGLRENDGFRRDGK